MKVTDIKTYVVDCFRTNWVFVKVETDEGISGVGEGTLEYKEKALVGAIEHIKSYLVGKDPRQIEKHYHVIYRDAYWRGGAVLMSALSAVEMALWDILGKSLGVPVYQLLGGKVNNMNHIDASLFAKRVGARYSVPMHVGMFDEMSAEIFDCPTRVIPTIYQPIIFE